MILHAPKNGAAHATSAMRDQRRTSWRLIPILLAFVSFTPLLGTAVRRGSAFTADPRDRWARPPKQQPITLRSDLVVIPVRVLDREGRPVRGLKAGDFELFIEGKRQPIIFFSAEGEELSRPLALILLLDASGSIAATVHQQRSAVESLLHHLGPRTRLSVIRFSDRPQVIVPFTTVHQVVAASLSQMSRVEGPTAIFDALLFAVQHFRTLRADAPQAATRHTGPSSTTLHEAVGDESLLPDPVRKVIILLSDGLDTASRADYRSCIRAAQQADVTVYALHIPLYSPAEGSLKPRPAVRGFRDVAKQTGGRMFVIGSVAEALRPTARSDLTAVFQTILADIRHQYYLGCAAPESAPPGKYLRVAVGVKRAGVRVETVRRGFYAK